MGVKMVDSDKRYPEPLRQRSGGCNAGYQRARKSRASRHRDHVDTFPSKTAFRHSLSYDDRQLFDMIDRCASVKKSELRTAFPDLHENNTLDYHIGKLAEYGLIQEKDGLIYVYWHRAVKND